MPDDEIRNVRRVGRDAGDRAGAPRAQPRVADDEEPANGGYAIVVGQRAAIAGHFAG
jgi:hypothetical protein